MSIPDYQTLMLPLLKLASDGAVHRLRDTVNVLADQFSLSDAERVELLSSGTATVFGSRVSWARTYLKQAGLLDSPQRGTLQITAHGQALLATHPKAIDNKVLKQYESFRAFVGRSKLSDDDASQASANDAAPEQSPEDAMAGAYERLRKSLETELLDQVKAMSPAFFERLVVDLLVAMGYGGSRQDAGRAIGRSGDGGIDGIIKEDRLGLDVIYLQAKRWDGTVGRPEIQKLTGALQGQRASKGVFITASSYSRDALDYVGMISSKIILVDGDGLVSLMVDHNVGVSRTGVYELKKLDSDYFEGN